MKTRESAKNATKVKTNDSENESEDSESESEDSESESEDSDYAMEQLEDAETNDTKKSDNGFEVVSQHCKFCRKSSYFAIVHFVMFEL